MGFEEDLTPRQVEVLTLVAHGWSNAEVADQLAISRRTVEMHRSEAMRTIGAKSRADVVQWSIAAARFG